MGIRGKCFDFLSNLYLTSKARARYLDILSEEFPIKCGVRQGCPLSPILFNLFINDVLNGCEKYGVIFRWAALNDMSFGVNKCATMVVKPINYVSPLFSSEPTFYLGMYAIPKTSCYIYLDIPFTDDLLIDHIVQYMFSKFFNRM
ncbi:hypothetical protein PIROE2DRAFT_17875 [Piromyces sp. E2]|nr:hypothetical protein PIROE2DRAFT_17875 [Piromyces sp. E2]|eukprot:OUM57209.1 hypothetical protein PIROE2DRAFT_17875 [Piromyces sp. E2]